VLAEFERVGLDVEVVTRERDCEDGKRGCFESHQNIMEIALQRRLESFVVFEDDVVFQQRSHGLPIKSIIAETLEFVRKTPEMMVGLGGIAMSPVGSPVDGASWIRPTKFAYTHAYVVSATVAREIAELEYEGRHIDQVFIQSFQQSMALVVPTIAFQTGYIFSPTTTGSSVVYKALTMLRNVISATFFQIGMEYFFRGWGIAARRLGRL